MSAFMDGYREARSRRVAKEAVGTQKQAAATPQKPKGFFGKMWSAIKTLFGLLILFGFILRLVDGGKSVAGSVAHSEMDSAAEQVATNWMLASTGKGMCDTVTDKKLDIMQRGKAAYEWAKPEPAVLGKFSATCTYYMIGQKHVEVQSWAFWMVRQESTGNSESMFRGTEYMSTIQSSLAARNFIATKS